MGANGAFAGMKRREDYATTGSKSYCWAGLRTRQRTQPTLRPLAIAMAYRWEVTSPNRPAPPTFMVQAMKDAANLDQAQIIKGDRRRGKPTVTTLHSPTTGLSTLKPVTRTRWQYGDLENVSFSNTIGAVQLSAQTIRL